MRFPSAGFVVWVLVICFSACEKPETAIPAFSGALMELPSGFPEMEFPEDNAFSRSRWELGRKLFYDPILSRDSSKSCASCHKANLAFSDDVAFSNGVEEAPGTRNAPSLANVGYHPYFTREGGVPTLEMQVLVPVQEHNEFDFNILLIAERLLSNPEYVSMSQEAYDREPDAFVITRALATFERSLISGYSDYDKYINYNDESALCANALRGMDLFFSNKTNCGTCHGGFNFTNYNFENNGLYETYPDIGRMRLTGNPEDEALFKIPSLRNIALTAPYMHDGSMTTLEEVIEHYNNGGENHIHKNEIIHPLNLTEREKEDLRAFLNALTDEGFVNNPLFDK